MMKSSVVLEGSARLAFMQETDARWPRQPTVERKPPEATEVEEEDEQAQAVQRRGRC